MCYSSGITGPICCESRFLTIAEKLEPYGFIRIHRSVLVNASFVQDVRPCPTGEYELRLKNGREYTVTRTYREESQMPGGLLDWNGNIPKLTKPSRHGLGRRAVSTFRHS